MRKSEVLEMLNAIPGDPEVYLSRDEEGNGFLPVGYVLAEFAEGEGRDLEVLSPGDFDEDDPDVRRVVVVWP